VSRISFGEVELRRGQVVVLVALMLVVLVGITGLAVDVSGAYLASRYQRSIADGAALAGAQDLQTPGTRAIPADGYIRAREDAMGLLVAQLGTSAPTSCPAPGSGDVTGPNAWTSDIVNCQLPGTDYYVSILTPSPSPTAADPTGVRSVQVTIRRPHFGLAFARIFGFFRWNVVETSVAGIGYIPNYGVVTLRPPQPTKKNDPSCAPYCDQNYDDVKLSNSVLNVFNADVATNTNMALSGNGAAVNLDPGFKVYRYDQYQFWTGSPPSENIPNWIPDPDYTYPTRTNAYVGGVETNSAACLDEQKKVPAAYGLTVGDPNITCYKPGVYSSQLIVSQNTDTALLEPGVYFLDKGADISGTLIGGFEGGQPGVALVFPECGTSQCQFNGANAQLIALNFGDKYQKPSGDLATAALTAWNNDAPVQTNTDPAIPLTLLVTKDSRCYPADKMPQSCTGPIDASHQTLVLPGNGNLFLSGIQYAPSDNVAVNGNGSNTNGEIGQIISWTIFYSGGAVLNQVGLTAVENGVLRLDAVCSDASHASCVNPEATSPIP
jgi:Putative Flp pilus-assembly TadE/G-like